MCVVCVAMCVLCDAMCVLCVYDVRGRCVLHAWLVHVMRVLCCILCVCYVGAMCVLCAWCVRAMCARCACYVSTMRFHFLKNLVRGTLG